MNVQFKFYRAECETWFMMNGYVWKGGKWWLRWLQSLALILHLILLHRITQKSRINLDKLISANKQTKEK